MKSGAFFFVGGCAGSLNTPSERVATWAPETEEGITYKSFDRRRYGSRTTNFLVIDGNSCILIDNGSGIKNSANLILDIFKREGIVEARVDVLQTHYHVDHVNGMIENALLWRKGITLRYFSPDLSPYNPPPEGTPPQSMERVFGSYYNPPKGFWPVWAKDLLATLEFISFKPGENLYVGERGRVAVKTMPLSHKGGCCGYRIEPENCGPIVILTDHEPTKKPEPQVVAFLEGGQFAALDMQYPDDQLPSHVGWGHGSPLTWFPTLLACEDGPRMVRITHHDPSHSDSDLDRFSSNSIVVYEKLAGEKIKIDYRFAACGDLYKL
jgi:glyoxylase-like metal-dependent hydrolase (beta-lactamase superfamily II)